MFLDLIIVSQELTWDYQLIFSHSDDHTVAIVLRERLYGVTLAVDRDTALVDTIALEHLTLTAFEVIETHFAISFELRL